MSTASFCDRCNGMFYHGNTTSLLEHPTVAKGTIIQLPNGFWTAELCELCSVELRQWLKT